MRRRLAAVLLAALALAAPAPAQTENYTWASENLNPGGAPISYWADGLSGTPTWIVNGFLSSGWPGFTSGDTAAFPAKVSGSINPTVNTLNGPGSYTFSSLSIDNTQSDGWTFLVDDAANRLTLLSSGTALNITGSAGTVTFDNQFGVGANGQTWALGGDTVFGATIDLGSNNLVLAPADAATVTLNGDLTGGGGLTIGATGALGTVVVNGANGGYTRSVTVISGATLAGTGSFAPGSGGSVGIAGTVSPGTASSVGTFNFGSSGTPTTVNLTGTYGFNLSSAGTGNVGFNTGNSGGTVDLLNVRGTLNLTGSTVNVSSLGSTGFDNTKSYSWLIATTNGGTVNGASSLGTVSGTDFSGLGSGHFFLGASGGNMFLNFTPTPEPAAVLGLAALGLVGALRRAGRRDGRHS